MNTQQFIESLKQQLGTNLKSITLYGSAATQDQTKRFSDINLLIVAESLPADVLRQLMPTIKKWTATGNPVPQFFTSETIRGARDVFPLEFLDIRASHQTLFGDDIFTDMQISLTHLKHQLEFELRGKLLLLTQRYLQTNADPKQVAELLARSLSTLTVLFKGVLMLIQSPVPSQKKEVWTALYTHVPIDQEALALVWDIRQGTVSEKSADVNDLYSRVMLSLEMVIRFVDQVR